MSDQKERLIVEADVSSVSRGAKTLDQFVGSATRAGESVDRFGEKAESSGAKAEGGASGTKKLTDEINKNKTATTGASSAIDRQKTSVDSLIPKLDSTAKQLAILSIRQGQMNAAQKAGLIGTKYAQEYNKTLEERRKILLGTPAEKTATGATQGSTHAATTEANALADAQKRVEAETRSTTTAINSQGKAANELFSELSGVERQLAIIELRQTQMSEAQSAGLIGAKYAQEYNQMLERRKQLLLSMPADSAVTGHSGGTSTSAAEAAAMADAQRKQADAAEKAREAIEKQRIELGLLLDKIKPTRTSLRELQDQQEQLANAQKSGAISSSEAAEYNQILSSRRQVIERTDAALRGYNTTASKQKVLQDGLTISTGQYKAAMGMLPAQMTDIVTQLAGGQNPFLIMIQQGGQIKDSFGGLKNTFTAMRQFISPTFLGTAASVAAIAGIGYAAYEAGERIKEMTRSVIMMGGQGAASVAELNAMSEKLNKETNSGLSDATAILVELNDKGKYTSAQMYDVAKAITKFGQAGNDTKAAMSGFDALLQDPVRGLAKLNSQYGFVTESQMKHLIQTKKAKGEYAAAQEAVNIWADVLTKRSDDVIDKTDGTGKAWRSMKSTASDVFYGIGVTIRAWSNEAIAGVQAVGAALRVLLADGGVISEKLSIFLLEPLVSLVDKIPGVGKTMANAMKESIDTSRKNLVDYEKRSTDANADYQKYYALAGKSQAWHEEQVRNGDGAKGSGATDEQSRDRVNKLADDANKKKNVSVALGDRLTEQYEAQALSLQSQIAIMEKRGAFDNNASQQQRDYLLLQAKISILEKIRADSKGRALTNDEKSLLANKNQVLTQAKIVAGYGERLQKLQKEAQLSDELTKSHNTIAAKVKVISDSWGMSADEMQRAMDNAERASALRDKGATPEQIDDDAKARKSEQDAVAQKTQDWKGGAKSALESWGKSASNVSDLVKTGFTSAMDTSLDALNNFVTTGKFSFASFTKSILGMIVQIINKWLMFKAISAAGSAMGFDMSFMSASPTPNAKGGVYDSPSLSQYSNGVYSSPQPFTFQSPTKFAKGGVFGEAGPEAIMPLTRDSNGRLGVRAQGASGGGGGLTVNSMEVNIQDGRASSKTSSDSGAVGRAYAETITEGANAAIEKALKPGGRIWQAQNGHA